LALLPLEMVVSGTRIPSRFPRARDRQPRTLRFGGGVAMGQQPSPRQRPRASRRILNSSSVARGGSTGERRAILRVAL